MNDLRSMLILINQFAGTQQRTWQKAKYLPEYQWCLMVLIAALLLTTINWTVKQISGQINLSRASAQILKSNEVTQPVNLSAKRLMGEPIKQTIPPENIQIQAIIFNSKVNKREAIIGDGQGSVKSYKIGDRLSGGSIITAIEKDTVTIERDGVYNTLRINDLPASFVTDKPLPAQESIFN